MEPLLFNPVWRIQSIASESESMIADLIGAAPEYSSPVLLLLVTCSILEEER